MSLLLGFARKYEWLSFSQNLITKFSSVSSATEYWLLWRNVKPAQFFLHYIADLVFVTEYLKDLINVSPYGVLLHLFFFFLEHVLFWFANSLHSSFQRDSFVVCILRLIASSNS